MKWLGWTGSVFLGLIAISGLITLLPWSGAPAGGMPSLYFILLGCVLAAALLLFPPFWRKLTPRWNYIRVIAAIVLAGVCLFAPIKTHAVKLDMPLPSQSR